MISCKQIQLLHAWIESVPLHIQVLKVAALLFSDVLNIHNSYSPPATSCQCSQSETSPGCRLPQSCEPCHVVPGPRGGGRQWKLEEGGGKLGTPGAKSRWSSAGGGRVVWHYLDQEPRAQSWTPCEGCMQPIGCQLDSTDLQHTKRCDFSQSSSSLSLLF